MLRNSEYRVMLIIALAVLGAGTAAACIINLLAGGVVMITGSILIGIFIFYTARRYRDIEKLSGYLRQIYSGDYSLDIRDNQEGELSILKNDIYKVTLILSKQAQLLQTEKEQLADAISDISHQLKTPLTSMMVMTDLLKKSDLDPLKRKEFTKNLGLSLERMEWLLTSLLKLSKLDAGTVKFKKECIDVNELIQQAMKALLIPMELKEQKLTIQGNQEVTFIGDLKWTTEALINIIKNCIEHTSNGGEIKIQFNDNPIFTEIVIQDNGTGINKEDLPYIFKRFYKGKNANEDSVGIGLAMAKSIIISQNGDVNVTSRKNQGTSFSIKFYKKVS